MTIVSRARALDAVLGRSIDQERTRLKVGRARDRAARLEEQATMLESLAEATGEVVAVGRHLPPALLDEARVAADIGREQIGAVRKEPLNAAGEDFEGLVRRTTELARKLTGEIQQAWEEHRSSISAPNVDEDLLERLSRSGVDVDAVRSRVEHAKGRFMVVRSRRLPARDDAHELARYVEDLQQAVQELGAMVPEPVREFLMAASGPPGAPLSQLSEDVLEFLIQRNLESRYRIRLVSP